MIYIAKVIVALALGVGGSDYRRNYPLPTLEAPTGWGINIHFTHPGPGEIQKLSGAGFKWIRMDCFWSGIEKERGRYDFSAYDDLMKNLRSVGIRPLFFLCYGNDLYEHGSPRTQQSRDAFCRFAEAAVTHFKGKGVVWEMWNEPNITFWQPKPNVDEYIALAKAVGETIRRVAPEEWYIGPGVSTFDWSFLQSCLNAGLLNYWDAVSTHPYRGGPPETVVDDWARLRSMIQTSAPRGRSIPMISSEWGYSDISGGIGLERQGEYAVRMYLADLMSGVPLSILYDWKNDGVSTTDPECNFGTVKPDLQPKPSYREIQRISSALNGFTFKMRLVQDSPLDFVLAFQKAKAVKYVAWTTAHESHRSRLHLGPDSLELSLSETPTLWNSGNPALVLNSSRLPESFEIREPAKTVEFLRSILGGLPLKTLKTQSASVKLRVYRDSASPEFEVTQEKRDQTTQMVAGLLNDDWSPSPKTLQVAVDFGNGMRLAQAVVCTQSRPVSADVIVTGGKSWEIFHNPGHRSFSAKILVESATGRASVGSIVSTGQVDQVVQNSTKTALAEGDRLAVAFGHQTLDWTTPSAFDRFSSDSSGQLSESRFALTQDGDPKIPVTMSAKAIRVEDGPLRGEEGVRIDYQFVKGWKFLEFHARGDLAKPLTGHPIKLNMFIKGDASGDKLLMRFTDSKGQTFQPEFGAIDWQGWKYVSFDLSGKQAWHWGGPDDGAVHYPIHLETLALIDSQGRAGKSESVQLAGITLIRRN